MHRARRQPLRRPPLDRLHAARARATQRPVAEQSLAAARPRDFAKELHGLIAARKRIDRDRAARHVREERSRAADHVRPGAEQRDRRHADHAPEMRDARCPGTREAARPQANVPHAQQDSSVPAISQPAGCEASIASMIAASPGPALQTTARPRASSASASARQRLRRPQLQHRRRADVEDRIARRPHAARRQAAAQATASVAIRHRQPDLRPAPPRSRKRPMGADEYGTSSSTGQFLCGGRSPAMPTIHGCATHARATTSGCPRAISRGRSAAAPAACENVAKSRGSNAYAVTP